MKILSLAILLASVSIPSIVMGQSTQNLSMKQDTVGTLFYHQMNYTQLFESNSIKRNQPSFDFLKQYQFKFYDVSNWYVNDNNGIIPYIQTYYNPSERFHLETEKYMVIKKK